MSLRMIRCAIYYWTIVSVHCLQLDVSDLYLRCCCFHCCCRCCYFYLDFHIQFFVFLYYSMICRCEKDRTKIHFLCFVATIYDVDDAGLNCHDFLCILSGKSIQSLHLDQCCQLSCVNVFIDVFKEVLWEERKRRTDIVDLNK